jgi:hypothetical protein
LQNTQAGLPGLGSTSSEKKKKKKKKKKNIQYHQMGLSKRQTIIVKLQIEMTASQKKC